MSEIKRDSFVLYAEYEDYFNELSDSDGMKLMKAIFAYKRCGEVKELDGMAKAFFMMIRNNLDMDQRPYGEKHWAWKGGATKQNRLIRNSSRYLYWRRLVLERDGYECVKCKSEINLNVHHIVPFAKDHSKRFLIDNGITLCKRCHQNEHRKGNNK